MSLHKIKDIEGLHRHLHAAIQLEHATIPPYLTALYSIHPGTNTDAYNILRVVAVEEMLHLTLAANMLSAVGGTPDLTYDGFVPVFPAYLPDGETDFQVNCERFSKETVEAFMQIERPARGSEEGAQTIQRKKKEGSLRAA
ncbi:MAG: ferritin-like protein, partial [Thermoanaerobaculia bacterium]|nr:ferritin-like protein [Thermoanaerobaculia bacterium]